MGLTAAVTNVNNVNLANIANMVNVANVATGGVGTVGNPWMGWEAYINANPTGSYYFQPGSYKLSTALILGVGCALVGANYYRSIITTSNSFTGNAITLSLTKNGSDLGALTLKDFAIVEGNSGNSSGIGVLLQSFGQGQMERVLVGNFSKGVVFDQTEDFTCLEVFVSMANDFGGTHKPIGFWFVNGADIRSGTLPGFTNNINLIGCQINMGAVDQVGIADDGGVTRAVIGCGINGGLHAMVLADVTNAVYSGCYMEAQTGAQVLENDHTWFSNAAVGQCSLLTFQSCNFSQTVGQPAIGRNSMGTETLIGNLFTSNAGNATNGGNNCFQINAIGNVTEGSALVDTAPGAMVDFTGGLTISGTSLTTNVALKNTVNTFTAAQTVNALLSATALAVNGSVAGNAFFCTSGTNDIYLNYAAGGISFFHAAGGPATQQVSGANLTNNVTAGGTANQIDNWTSLTVYATDAVAIRNAVYQLAAKLKQVNDALRVYGLLS